jgi:hypothetical protein
VAIVVIGGHSRSVGKTSVVAGIISALPAMDWTAFKVTQFGHGICSAHGKPCGCETDAHLVAVSEERERASGTDSSRYLAAGAARSFWVRTRQGNLAEAMPRLRKEIAAATNAILESNSVMKFLRPDLYVAVLDSANADFKPSALEFLDRADAFIVTSATLGPAWKQVAPKLLHGKPLFMAPPPIYVTPELIDFVRERLQVADSASTPR